jgi:dipeptidase D
MENGPYCGLEPATLWRHFAALNVIPRPSGREAAVREYVRGVAQAAGAEWETDASGNAIVRVGAGKPIAAVQAHLDMVCERGPGVEHDCERDPILPRRDGDVVSATGTTLGADNGIGVAAALALLSESAAYGPIELLFTVEEETGLHGATALDVSMLRAESLINLDSEDDGALTVGCAGGVDVEIVLPLDREPAVADRRVVELRVSGLAGGHSGMQIHERRANAISLAARALDSLQRAGAEFRLEAIEGGSAHNAIPREATIRLALADEEGERVLAATLATLSDEWGEAEPDFELELVSGLPPAASIRPSQAAAIIGLLSELPHGVIAMSERFPGTVETSANLAIVRSEPDRVQILASVRSLERQALGEVRDEIVRLAHSTGADAETGAGYPPWEPREHSPLLDTAIAAYAELHGREPRIEVLHGGLECGVIVARKPGLDAISLGPLIEGAHTPGERVHASTVADAYRLLVVLLGRLADNGKG